MFNLKLELFHLTNVLLKLTPIKRLLKPRHQFTLGFALLSLSAVILIDKPVTVVKPFNSINT
jgi:hypothetical protein